MGLYCFRAVLLLLLTISYVNSDPVLYSDLNCKSGVENLTAFQELMCRVAASPLKIQPKCIPMYWEPQSSQVRGAVAFFHGFSACPGAYRNLAERLQKEGFYVYSFLTPGHGREYGTCISEKECSKGYPVESLPIDSEGYELFVKESNTIFKSELDRLGLDSSSHTIVSSGLSHGASLSAYAVHLDNKLYSHWIPFAPFFGIAADELDSAEVDCENDIDKCLQVFVNNTFSSVFNSISGGNTSIPSSIIKEISVLLKEYIQKKGHGSSIQTKYSEFQSITRSCISNFVEYAKDFPSKMSLLLYRDFTWGKKCYLSKNTAKRSGFCDFKVQHIFAAHSFSEKSLLLTRFFQNISSQFILTERDGRTRNSLSMFAAQSVLGAERRGGVCLFYKNPGPENEMGNTNGVPHSMIDPSDNEAVPPYSMPWEENYIGGVISWLRGEVSNVGLPYSQPREDLLYKCVQQPVVHPKLELFGQVPTGGVLNIVKPTRAYIVHDEISQFLCKTLRIQTWTLNLVQSNKINHLEGGYKLVSFVFELPLETLKLLDDLVHRGALRSISGFPISYLKVDTRPARIFPIENN